MNVKEVLSQYLERYINQTIVNEEFGVYFIKELVGRTRNMKIEIYGNDHNPPHFHVKSNDLSIDATFRLDDCELLKGEIGRKDKKRIEAFFADQKSQLLMRELWNKSKSGNSKIL